METMGPAGWTSHSAETAMINRESTLLFIRLLLKKTVGIVYKE
jgi:hypothetical protein